MAERVKAPCTQQGQAQHTQQPARRLIRRKEVERLTGLSKTAIYTGANAGTFPKPCPLSDVGTSVAWVESEILAWIDARVSAREAA